MSKKALKNVGIILGCSIVAKILSYVWEAVLAAYLGASDQADAFYIKSSIYNILYPMLDLGIWKVFLPAYKKKLVQQSEEEASKLANIAETFFLCLSVALVLFIVVLAHPLVSIAAPGFSPEKKALAAEYLRISAPMYLLMASSSIIGAMLQCHDRFLGSQIREIGTHVSKIAFLLLCFRSMGIYAAIAAFIVGSLFRLLVQLPFINWKWKFRPDFHFRDPEIGHMIKGLPSVALTAAINHVNGLIDKMVASGSAAGSVSCLNYGSRLLHVFSGMISTAIGTATYPTMIQYIAQKEDQKLRSILTSIINALAFCILPITGMCMLFSTEIVTAAFQRGAFDASATVLTAGVFMGYCVGMPFDGITTVVTNVFYGYGDTWTTMLISVLNIALNICFDLLFVRFFGVAGLAFATSISTIICLGVRLLLLRKYIRLDYRSILKEVAKILLVSAVAVGLAYLVFAKLLTLNLYLSLILTVLLIAGVYLALARLMRLSTLNYVLSIVKKRFLRRRG